jgi:uncharacterized protein (DUF305 family)
VKPLLRPLLLLLALPLVAACGDEEAADGTAGNGVDRAFVAEMVPHHEGAVAMAKIAQERAQRPEIKQLTAAIIKTQNAEIETLNGLAARLEEAGIEQGELGVPEDEMGMSHDPSMLGTARPFDREFIDMMIPHHQGAIRMARVEIAKGDNPDAKRLAEAIVQAQTKEIDEMNMWRVDWYGALSPAGGVPSEDHH